MSGLACDLGAIAPSERPRYDALRQHLKSALSGRRELENGYVFTVRTESLSLTELADWITLERKCCPFLNFAIEIGADGGPTTLKLTGPDGVKQILGS